MDKTRVILPGDSDFPTEAQESGWRFFGTIGFEAYRNFVLYGQDTGIDLETVDLYSEAA